MNNEIQEAYAAGYDDGHGDGYNAGYNEAKAEGSYDDGHGDGYNAGYDAGFDAASGLISCNTSVSNRVIMKDNLQFHADYDDSQIIQHLAFSKGGSWHTGSTEIRNVFGDFIITKQLQIIPVSVLSDLQIAELAPRRKVPAKKVMLAVCRSAGVMK